MRTKNPSRALNWTPPFHECLEWQICLGLFTETKKDLGRIDWLVMCLLHHKIWIHFIFLLVHIIWGRKYVPLIKNAIAENKGIIFIRCAWLYILSIEAEKDILWASFCVYILWGGQCHTCKMLKSCEAGMSHLYMSTRAFRFWVTFSNHSDWGPKFVLRVYWDDGYTFFLNSMRFWFPSKPIFIYNMK